ncbi:MAG TPA: c-type cytochrome domain-containing protein [Bdellovibrio sp.]|uniref:c-type cytochrome domain-containing protein n=1 Tax=Bdellovibrio sp. TaxID=28201 RepID=UPI002EE9DE38
MKKLSLILFISMAGLSFVGCSYPLEEAGLFKSGKSSLPDLGALSYADQEITFNVVKSTAMRACMECHTNGKNAMGTEAQALAISKSILDEVNSNQMPPKSSGYKSLTDCEKQILETYFADKAVGRKSVKIKELAKCAGALPPPKEDKPDITKLPVTFDNLQKYVLAPKCLSCHGHEVHDVETVLDSVEGMKEAGVLGATAEESKIWKITDSTQKRYMPPAKSGLPALTADERLFLKKWIDAGAKEQE